MKYPTQEEKDQAMENMECWKTQEHLKECRKCAPVGNMKTNKELAWLEITWEFIKRFEHTNPLTNRELSMLYFFKPYFQEQMHTEAVEELEIVDNSKALKEI